LFGDQFSAEGSREREEAEEISLKGGGGGERRTALWRFRGVALFCLLGGYLDLCDLSKKRGVTGSSGWRGGSGLPSGKKLAVC